MSYEQLSKQIESLNYRDKLRLAQLLIQLARTEEEEQNAAKRVDTPDGTPEAELVQYVAQRLKKLKPTRRNAALNSISAMFQFQGGLSDIDKEKIFAALVQQGHIVLGDNSRIRVND